MTIRSRAALRIGLAGGGTDLSPYCDDYGGAVLNATIRMFAYCTIEPADDGRVCFFAKDINECWSMDSADMDSGDYPRGVQLHVGVYRRIIHDYNGGKPLSFSMVTSSDGSLGSGLGGSSTLVVAIVKAFVEWLNLPLGEYDIAWLAWEIERMDMGLEGGRQDQYAATFGGLNFMEFSAHNKVVVNPLRIKPWIRSELEDSLLLYYTGRSRESAQIIHQQIKAVREDQHRLQGLHDLKQIAYQMKEAILRGNFSAFADALNAGWQAKKSTSDVISNPQIDTVYAAVMEAGGIAGKLSGAGGGGFFMFYVDPARRIDVVRKLSQFPGSIATTQLTEEGVVSWTIH